jgi:hypothetical protein
MKRRGFAAWAAAKVEGRNAAKPRRFMGRLRHFAASFRVADRGFTVTMQTHDAFDHQDAVD